jgi:hypothetical protein
MSAMQVLIYVTGAWLTLAAIKAMTGRKIRSDDVAMGLGWPITVPGFVVYYLVQNSKKGKRS